jgi:hypothetical protein
MRTKGMRLTALLLVAAVAALTSCTKLKSTATEAKDNVKTHAGDAADKAKEVVSKDYVLMTISSPAGASMKVIQGKAWNPQNEERQETFRVPFEVKLNIPTTTLFEVTYNKQTFYLKVDTLAATDYTKMSKLRLDIPTGVIAQVMKGEMKTTTLKDPNNGTALANISMGNRSPGK